MYSRWKEERRQQGQRLGPAEVPPAQGPEGTTCPSLLQLSLSHFQEARVAQAPGPDSRGLVCWEAGVLEAKHPSMKTRRGQQRLPVSFKDSLPSPLTSAPLP